MTHHFRDEHSRPWFGRRHGVERKQFLTTAAAGGESGTDHEITISTVNVDRDRDRLFPEGVDATAYLKNPCVLFGHDPASIPVGIATGLDVRRGEGIRMRFRFLEGDEFARRAENAYRQGVLRAASVGFIPIESVPNEHGGADFHRWELAEVSLVPVPSNREALAIRSLRAEQAKRNHPGPELVIRVDDLVIRVDDLLAAIRKVVNDAVTSALHSATPTTTAVQPRQVMVRTR